jgi:urease accessory protein
MGVTSVAARKLEKDVFAANRAVGRVTLAVEAVGGVTRRNDVAEAGSLRVRFPNVDDGELEAVLVNTAGGIAGGDQLQLGIAVGKDARLALTTAAAEKIYRSLGPNSTIDVKLRVAAGGALRWLPQETILFDRARMTRHIEVDLATDATLLMAEALVFGRSAMGETVAQGRLFDRWRVRRDGRLIFADTTRVDGGIEANFAAPAVARGAVAMATVLCVPGGDAAVAAVRTLGDGLRGEVGVSAWNGIALARLLAADGAILRRDLAMVLSVLSRAPLPRLWVN